MTWFRAHPDIAWMSPDQPGELTRLAEAFLRNK
jgi:hypothetical protein